MDFVAVDVDAGTAAAAAAAAEALDPGEIATVGWLDRLETLGTNGTAKSVTRGCAAWSAACKGNNQGAMKSR